MEDNKNLSEELEQMRTQFNQLKEKLKNQEIVNDHLVRQAMKRKMSWIEKYVKIEMYVLLPFVLLDCLIIVFILDMSWWWYIYTALFMIFEIAADYYINIHKAANFDSNLIEAANVLAWQKKKRIQQLYADMPLLIIWVVWLGIGIISLNTGGKEFLEGMKHGCIGGGIVGFAIGMFLGIKYLLKMQRINTELIQQINEMTEK